MPCPRYRKGDRTCLDLLGDLAALLLTLLLAHLDPALALAAVLAGAGVGRGVTTTFALARIDALAVDLAARRRIGGADGEGGGAGKQAGGQGGNQGTFGADHVLSFGISDRGIVTVYA